LFANNGIASEAYGKIRETCIPRGNSNIGIDALPKLQISVGFIALFEKIYYGELIFAVISNNGEDVQYLLLLNYLLVLTSDLRFLGIFLLKNIYKK
jgi:hypothetical protein